ncbi:hypothetical protein PIIN_03665 [Serendipita indica DSM 11827]|uniref:Uncharacterized protein n=1 Tax=Serendipita indica (strain DSM 11827) TaxID=1109443 RepID=G4TEI1_SERID|nr:hypothetical protein PIIN_03665 [Serendipita indica DSM 11827]
MSSIIKLPLLLIFLTANPHPPNSIVYM